MSSVANKRFELPIYTLLTFLLAFSGYPTMAAAAGASGCVEAPDIPSLVSKVNRSKLEEEVRYLAASPRYDFVTLLFTMDHIIAKFDEWGFTIDVQYVESGIRSGYNIIARKPGCSGDLS